MESAWNLSFTAFGGLSALRDGTELDLGGPKQRLVLALLLLAEGEPVGPDVLVDSVWGGAPPDRAESSLQAYVSNLRRVLEPDRAPRRPATVLVTRPAGYALLVARQHFDLTLFVDRAGVGIEHQRHGRPGEAVDALAEAGGLWKPLLPEFVDVAAIDETARRIEVLRSDVLDHLFAARLDLGESSTIVADLRAAVDADPLDERLWAHLALSLYRSGRQSDALRSIADARRVLAEEVGVDPGPALRALESAILDQSPSLDRVVGGSGSGPGPDPAPDADPGLDADPVLNANTAPVRSASPFVGRGRDLELLVGAVRGVGDRGGVAAVISGEPGIGKTRLAEELVGALQPAGTAVAWARCPESAATSPFFALTEITAQLQSQGVVDLTGVLGTGTDAGISDPLALYRGVTAALKGMTRPALVVVDDLQWADPGTLRLVEFVAGELRNLPVALVVTTRPRATDWNEPLVDCLGELARCAGSARIDLDGLDAQAVAEWLDRRTDDGSSPDLARLVHDRSGGNPFFVEELVEMLAGEGRIDEVRAGRIPAAVSDVVRRRVGRLPDESQQLLSVASVVGRTFDVDVVASVAQSSLASVLDALDAPVAAGLVHPDPTAPTRFRFSHALVVEALETELSPSRRARLHASTAVAFATLRAATIDDHLAELAHHALAGALAGSAADAVVWSIRAGARAEALGAPEDAAGHYERALGVADLAHPGDMGVRLDLLRSLGRSWAAAGSEERAQTVLADAVEVADQIDDLDALVACALALVHPTLWQPGEYRSANERLVSVVDLVLARLGPSGDASVRALLDGFRSNLTYYVTPADQLDTRSAAAVELARSTGDDDVIARVLVQRIQAIWFAPNAARQLEAADEVLAIDGRSGLDAQLRAVVELQRMCALYQMGSYDRVAFERLSVLTREQGSPIQVLEVEAFAAARLACEGRYVDAQRVAADAEELFRRTARRSGAAVMFGAKVLSFIDRGMLDEISEMAAQVSDSTFGPSSIEMIALVLAEFGRLDDAREVLGPVGSLSDPPADWMWLAVSCAAALVRAALGDVDACSVLYDRLLPFSGQVWIIGSVPVGGSVDLALGRMAMVLGRHDAALDHIERAIRVDGSMGARAWLARSLEAKADITGEAADRRAAFELAAEIGCTPVLRRLGS